MGPQKIRDTGKKVIRKMHGLYMDSLATPGRTGSERNETNCVLTRRRLPGQIPQSRLGFALTAKSNHTATWQHSPRSRRDDAATASRSMTGVC